MRANYLASPPLVVAYALGGTADIDFEKRTAGKDRTGNPVYLRDIWPSQAESRAGDGTRAPFAPICFRESYANVWDGNPTWNAIPVAGGALYEWRPRFHLRLGSALFSWSCRRSPPRASLHGARVLARARRLGITTDHISPAGSIEAESPAGTATSSACGVAKPKDFNSYGSRRGNDRGHGARDLRQHPSQEPARDRTEGGVTRASARTRAACPSTMPPCGTKPKACRCRSWPATNTAPARHRDWAAKGHAPAGIEGGTWPKASSASIASNLVGMGVLPLEFSEGQIAASLALTGAGSVRHRRTQRRYPSPLASHGYRRRPGWGAAQLPGDRPPDSAVEVNDSQKWRNSTGGSAQNAEKLKSDLEICNRELASLVPLSSLTRPRTSGTPLPQRGRGSTFGTRALAPLGERVARTARVRGKVHRENLPFHNSLFTIYYL